jgi:hypothetical protein
VSLWHDDNGTGVWDYIVVVFRGSPWLAPLLLVCVAGFVLSFIR